MKKIFTLFSISMLVAINLNAQVLNSSFENWEQRSFTLDVSAIAPIPLPPETYNYNTPEEWTTGNQITNSNLLGGNELVSQSSTNVVDGSSSIRLETDILSIPLAGDFTVPGFVISGAFDVELVQFISVFGGGGNVNFASIPKSGQPYTERAESLVGHINYAPTGSDSCWIFSALVRNVNGEREVIAIAELVQQGNTNGTTFFSADYEYFNCATPDTVVTLISSSYIDPSEPYTGLEGSVLFVDSLAMIVPSTPILFAPILEDDELTVFVNESGSVEILLNDAFCDGDEDNVTIVLDTDNGVSVLNANNVLEYTPEEDYEGTETLIYEICNSAGCDQATVVINVIPYPPCVASDLTLTLNSGQNQNIVPLTTDCDNTTLAISTQPSNGTASVVNGELVYESNEGFTGSDSFQYTVCSDLDPSDCDEATVFITVVLSLNEISTNLFSIYPNPVENNLNITLDINENANVSIYNASGQIVLSKDFVNTTNLNTSNLSNGIYFIRLQTENGIAHQKIQVSK